MPPPLLLDLNKIDLNSVCMTKEQVYEILPHKHEFMLLDGVCHLDPENWKIVAYRDIREDDWWFRGHVPGRPLLPGVLMIEMAAHAVALMAKVFGSHDNFIALGGVDTCKFRDAVTAPSRLHLIGHGRESRPRRVVADTQGVIGDRMIFEAEITGMLVR